MGDRLGILSVVGVDPAITGGSVSNISGLLLSYILPSPVRPSRLHRLLITFLIFISLADFYSILGVQGILGESRSLRIRAIFGVNIYVTADI